MAVGNAARFNSPTGIAVDRNGNLYVCDTGNQLIRKISSSGVVSTIAGVFGQIGANDGPGGSADSIPRRASPWVHSGNVYVADMANNTIRQITP